VEPSSYGDGQADPGCGDCCFGVVVEGVPIAGGGKAESMPERPELCLSSRYKLVWTVIHFKNTYCLGSSPVK
jgi:hypothetical protein